MPTSPLPPCRYEGCANRCQHGERYCAEHRPLMERHYDSFTRAYDHGERYGHHWAKIRKRYAAAHPLCEMCLKRGRYVDVQEVHHIKPLSEGGTDDESNLMSLCRSCHTKIHLELGDRGHPYER